MAARIYRWKCPFESCNFEQSGLLDNEDQVSSGFTSHLEQRHTVPQLIPFILGNAKWLWSASIAGERTESKLAQEAAIDAVSDPSKP